MLIHGLRRIPLVSLCFVDLVAWVSVWVVWRFLGGFYCCLFVVVLFV